MVYAATTSVFVLAIVVVVVAVVIVVVVVAFADRVFVHGCLPVLSHSLGYAQNRQCSESTKTK